MISALRKHNATTHDIEWYLAVAFTAFIVCVEAWILFFAMDDGSIQLRLGLAVFALCVIAVCFLGALRGTVHPLAAIVGFPLAVVYGYTGLIIPWEQRSYFFGQLALETVLSIPFVGEMMAILLFGGFSLSLTTLRHAVRLHYTALVIALLVLLYGVVQKLRRTPSRNSDARD